VFRELLQNALTVTVALVGQRQDEEMRTLTVASLAQNKEVKLISAWAAILFAPHPGRHHLRHEPPTPCPSCTGRWVPDGGVPHDRHGAWCFTWYSKRRRWL